MHSALVYENVDLPAGQAVKVARYHFPEGNPLEIAPHFHMLLEVMVFVRARGYAMLDGERFDIESGSVLFLSSLTVHELHMEGGDQDFFLLQFDPSLLEGQELEADLQKFAPFLNRVDGRELERLTMLLDWCCDINEQPAQVTLRNRVMQLLVHNLSQLVASRGAGLAGHSSAVGRLEPVLQHFKDSKQLSLPLDDAAALCGISRSHFSRLFHQTLNLRYQDFLLKRKLQHAVYLLVNTRLRIADIACQCEFSDSAHFCSKFKRLFSVTPQQFRKATVENL
ncbi:MULTISPECIES: helix-turn-helix transcriptional regulator [unclassified Microbulbifer]|uniref:helix-turn-helix transcriptional regulator n=1 Tax=unclassified Microbulbifer TaxID=2619833 RepID=UPI001E2E7102|nr:AraC family transcriptional regulator [Microbulbifer sp. YPW16]UHQ54377.1 AraC family transcriptional regulator [Microbulbifer sp. YPW16]